MSELSVSVVKNFIKYIMVTLKQFWKWDNILILKVFLQVFLGKNILEAIFNLN